ncbi:hypothetical protein OG787_08140 [Streptomyces sp. NBC_00075]|uniref:AraC family transcriptional regulator n=1 Tax=Streptomyces sp. NBC_00093 TaxID=2975649 RepID=A0AAU1ZTY8_9ACTN
MSTVEEFFAQHDDWPWNPPRPVRATFHYLIAVTEGELRHDVDHVTRTITPGQWLWVRPGHTLCWHPPGSARGPFILFEPDVLRPALLPRPHRPHPGRLRHPRSEDRRVTETRHRPLSRPRMPAGLFPLGEPPEGSGQFSALTGPRLVGQDRRG